MESHSVQKRTRYASGAASSVSQHRRKSWISFPVLEKWKDFALALPALLSLAIFTYYPLFYSLYLSMTDWNMIRPVKRFVGLDNYERMINDDMFFHVLKVTFTYTLLDVGLTVAFGLMLALLLNVVSPLYSSMRMIIFMPHYISMVISSMIFIWILNADYGVLNYVLSWFGIPKIYWLNDPGTALWSLLFVSIWKGVGFAMIIFIAGLRGIPVEYYEAASIDGASRLQRFRFITIPLLSPITMFLIMTTFIASMQVFQSVDVMTGGGPLDATRVMVMWIYQVAFDEFRIGRASALVVVFFTMILLLTIVQFMISKKKVHYEG